MAANTREESRIAANYLVHCRENETQDNRKERIRRNEKTIEMLENRLARKKANSIRRAYEQTTAKRITREYMVQIGELLKQKMKTMDPFDDGEILRRYSQLTEKNVAKSVKLAFAVLKNMNASYSTRGVIHESMRFLLRLVIAVRCICFFVFFEIIE